MFPFMTATNAFTTIPTPTPTMVLPDPTPVSITTFSSLVTLLLSFNALSDWLKFLIIGGLFESCRRVLFFVWKYLANSLWITVEFEQEDATFDWMMVWLSQQPSWVKSREIAISTQAYGLNSRAIVVPGEEDEAGAKPGRRVAYLPSFDNTYAIWYKRYYMRITRTKAAKGGSSSSEHLTLRILTRDHRVLNALLLEAKNTWHQAQERYVSIYASDASNYWRHIASRPKRPMKSIVLDAGMKELLLSDARDFLNSKNWYSDRGIPFRRGYLLHGTPGSGKTSMIHSLAGELGLNVYVISLSRIGLDDNGLQQLIADLPERCIALMEDIDAAFHQNINRNLDNEGKDEQNASAGPTATITSRISLSGLLNALDGVSAQEGRLLYATTNRYWALDDALTRPGRMDLHVEFKLASKYQASELFRCFYMPSGYVEDEKEEEDDNDTGSVDSGYAPSISSASDKDADSEGTNAEAEGNLSIIGTSHGVKGPGLSSRQAKVLAEKFGEVIPHREFSMASLQGYLMSYKARPFEAVAFASKWVQDQKLKKKSTS